MARDIHPSVADALTYLDSADVDMGWDAPSEKDMLAAQTKALMAIGHGLVALAQEARGIRLEMRGEF